MTWYKSFFKNGYTVFPKLIPPHLVSAARDAIAKDRTENYDPAREQEYENISHCPDLCNAPVIMDFLLKSPVWEVLNECLGTENIGHGGAQIAIRRAHNAEEEIIYDYHIDGVPNGLNGLKGQQISNFTALVGVFLNDIPRQFGGNLVVWPESHYVLEKYFRDQGPQVMNMGIPKVQLGQPQQIDASAGDVILCHYQLAHSVVSNTTDIDRIAVYFRIWLNDIGKRRWELLTNIWNGWKIA